MFRAATSDRVRFNKTARGDIGDTPCSEPGESCSLTYIDLSENELCGIDFYGIGEYSTSGIKALAVALSGTALTYLDVRWNEVGDEEEQMLRDAVEGRVGFQLLV